METYILGFCTILYIPEIKIYHFICRVYALYVIITVYTHNGTRLSIIDPFKMWCSVIIMHSTCLPVLHTKSNPNTMLSIDLCLLVALHYITLLLQHILYRCLYHHFSHIIMCFTHFFLMRENMILSPQSHTTKISFNC